ncbi:MAG: DUF3037 domain-containing protein [Thermomicrobiaceae bacterium]|nr:DUF3037 domain-containing protein [Thermomicrobiaceae bacterium]
MPEQSCFDYAIVRVVPDVERGEFINAGVILFCRERGFLDARIALDGERLVALAPGIDPAEVEYYLAEIPMICRGDPAAGPIARLPLSARFHWLTAPRSTVIQPSPVHSGLCDDPAAALDHLLETMVLRPPGGTRAR